MDVLRENLIKSLQSGQAFVSYKKGLAGIKPELRNIRPNKAIHSIYEELEHMRRAQEDLFNYMLDSDWESPNWPEGFWPYPEQVLSGKEWKKTVDGFFDVLKKTAELVGDKSINLLSIVPGATEYTYLREILIIIEHNSYHFGKILDKRKILDNWN